MLYTLTSLNCFIATEQFIEVLRSELTSEGCLIRVAARISLMQQWVFMFFRGASNKFQDTYSN